MAVLGKRTPILQVHRTAKTHHFCLHVIPQEALLFETGLTCRCPALRREGCSCEAWTPRSLTTKTTRLALYGLARMEEGT